jgi:hypothetical protein
VDDDVVLFGAGIAEAVVGVGLGVLIDLQTTRQAIPPRRWTRPSASNSNSRVSDPPGRRPGFAQPRRVRGS